VFVEAPLEIQVTQLLIAIAGVVADVVVIATGLHLLGRQVIRTDPQTQGATAIGGGGIELVLHRSRGCKKKT